MLNDLNDEISRDFCSKHPSTIIKTVYYYKGGPTPGSCEFGDYFKDRYCANTECGAYIETLETGTYTVSHNFVTHGVWTYCTRCQWGLW